MTQIRVDGKGIGKMLSSDNHESHITPLVLFLPLKSVHRAQPCGNGFQVLTVSLLVYFNFVLHAKHIAFKCFVQNFMYLKKNCSLDTPTSPTLFRLRLPLFFKNMLCIKGWIESSLDNIMVYVNDADDTRSPDENFTDSTNNSPGKKK
ncbi:uncharacterized protein EV154DRAFT_487276 [Mucor mucedo]|uniref:uncharacterized protein n=1 Tax=Mucor mucedo TaxID=29922 RepID=UPI0022201CAC|nr:uncharacterized protein EV154DRAFT_487276 [Mucor mucedo]KAI7873351.1 hypothetical protein EV154DRAFT_487276 [Mucor mucedo]